MPPSWNGSLRNTCRPWGGRGALEQVRSIIFTAEYTDSSGQSLPLSIQKKQPNKSRIVVMLPAGKLIRSYDGEFAWEQLPGRDQAEIMNAETARDFIREAPLSNALIRRDAKTKLTYLGVERLRSRDCHKIQVEREGTPNRVMFIDAENFIERAFIDYLPNAQGGFDEIETIPSDFRSVNGLMVAFGISSRKNGTPLNSIRIQSVIINPGLLDMIFRMP